MFFTPNISSFITNPGREFHHWNSRSEAFATTSQLVSAVLEGWAVNSTVIRRTFYFAGGRQTNIHYFELKRDEDYMTMPVQETPVLHRILTQSAFHCVTYGEKVTPSQRQRQKAYVANA